MTAAVFQLAVIVVVLAVLKHSRVRWLDDRDDATGGGV